MKTNLQFLSFKVPGFKPMRLVFQQAQGEPPPLRLRSDAEIKADVEAHKTEAKADIDEFVKSGYLTAPHAQNMKDKMDKGDPEYKPEVLLLKFAVFKKAFSYLNDFAGDGKISFSAKEKARAVLMGALANHEFLSTSMPRDLLDSLNAIRFIHNNENLFTENGIKPEDLQKLKAKLKGDVWSGKIELKKLKDKMDNEGEKQADIMLKSLDQAASESLFANFGILPMEVKPFIYPHRIAEDYDIIEFIRVGLDAKKAGEYMNIINEFFRKIPVLAGAGIAKVHLADIEPDEFYDYLEANYDHNLYDFSRRVYTIVALKQSGVSGKEARETYKQFHKNLDEQLGVIYKLKNSGEKIDNYVNELKKYFGNEDKHQESKPENNPPNIWKEQRDELREEIEREK